MVQGDGPHLLRQHVHLREHGQPVVRGELSHRLARVGDDGVKAEDEELLAAGVRGELVDVLDVLAQLERVRVRACHESHIRVEARVLVLVHGVVPCRVLQRTLGSTDSQEFLVFEASSCAFR